MGLQPALSPHLPIATNAVQNADGVLMLSMRIAAENLLGVLHVWDGDLGQATLTGYNAAGDFITVQAVQGSATATITVQGQSRTVDIADEVTRLYAAVGGEVTWPTGSIRVQNIGGVIFLPLRFLLQTYDIDIEWDAGTVHIHG